MTDPIGLIGLGLLGSAIGERLLAAGFHVIGFDIETDSRERFASSGGEAVTEVATIGSQCRRVVLSLPDSHISRTVTQQLAGVVPPNAVIIDTTTGDPVEMQEIGDELATTGIGYIDATIAGSSAQTRTGDVLMLIGGDEDHVAACRDLFEAIARTCIPVGSRGSGARMKLVVNLVLGLNRAVLAEGLTFAKTIGVDPALALEVLRLSPAASSVMATKGEKMVTGDFSPQARLRQHLKDVRLILEAAGDSKTPLSTFHADLLQSLVDRGYGDEDNSAVIRAFE